MCSAGRRSNDANAEVSCSGMIEHTYNDEVRSSD
jgi:hypothetical protein